MLEDLLFQNKRSSEGNDMCNFLYPYYDIFSEEALDELASYTDDFYTTGVRDMTDSEYYVSEYISNNCAGAVGHQGDAVAYIFSAIYPTECKLFHSFPFDQLEYINNPLCVSAECTDDSLIDLMEAQLSYDCGNNYIQNITVTRVDYNIAEESSISID
jgi:hypothetical protein